MENNIVGHLELIKKINRSLVLEKVRSHQPISRAQIAKELNLSKSTVSSIVDELVSRKLVIELGEGSTTKAGGRPAAMLGFNPSSAFGIGVDIGGTKILVIITDLAGKVVYKKKTKTTNKVNEIVELVKQSLIEAGIQEKDVIGMGIGVPGTTNDGVVIRAKALNWINYKLKDLVQSHFSFPIFINNDVNCAALGERWLGSGDRSDHLFFIAIGTGIGSAIIANGQLIYGHNSRAGEINYLIGREDMNNKVFNVLGETGVFEGKVSGSSLGKHGFTSEELFAKYSGGEAEVIPIIDEFVKDLAIGIANAVSLLNPEKVILGGGVSESMQVVVDDLQDLVNKLTPIRTEIRLANLGGDAGALGAIAFTFDMVEHN
ncbi:ROK family transcriptional regulator [Paenibacillaceae bacterium WGS1546]|uniref:ROK family transcriptional regulator n=1 Tax=Cohnella sp. WGS1546 TaxID=3366810 RepID=UPI00372D0E42